MAATLAEWAAQIADLRRKGDSADAEQQARIAAQVADLSRQRTEYRDQMLEMRDSSDAVFRDMQGRADGMATAFRRAYVLTTTRFAL
jgi:hypothetical protein